MDGDWDQRSRVVTAQDLSVLRDVVTEGADSKQPVVAGVRTLERHQMGQVRADATVRSLSQGPTRPGPGRPKTYEGKVPWSDVSRVARLEPEDEHIVLYHQGLHHGHLKRHLQLVVVVQTPRNRYAVLCSTAGDLEARTLYRSDKARVQSELLLRDATQFAGLSAGQARSHAQLDCHCKASLSPVTCATLEAPHQHGNCDQALSLASLKRRAFTQHLIDRICES